MSPARRWRKRRYERYELHLDRLERVLIWDEDVDLKVTSFVRGLSLKTRERVSSRGRGDGSSELTGPGKEPRRW